MNKERLDGRAFDQVRSVKVSHGIYGNAQGSVLFELGDTRVLCSIMLQDGVPSFLRGSGRGWLTAEYTMLPASTLTRTPREASIMRRNSRSIEISRLIGRSLRSIINLKNLGERTIYIDCDVLQADGGTRTAAINGAYCALIDAIQKWYSEGLIKKELLKDSVAAVSVGWTENKALLDINFKEDCNVDADFNFVLTGSGKVIEIQGATESDPISWDAVEQMKNLAVKGVKDIGIMTEAVQAKVNNLPSLLQQQKKDHNKKPASAKRSGMFSLKQRGLQV